MASQQLSSKDEEIVLAEKQITKEKQRLVSAWDEAFDEFGNFDYVFGDPTVGVACRVKIFFEEEEEYTVVVSNEADSKEQLEINLLKELQATIEEDIEEIETNILRFVATVYDYLSSQSPENPSLVYSAYENLENMKRGLADLKTERKRAQILSREVTRVESPHKVPPKAQSSSSQDRKEKITKAQRKAEMERMRKLEPKRARELAIWGKPPKEQEKLRWVELMRQQKEARAQMRQLEQERAQREETNNIAPLMKILREARMELYSVGEVCLEQQEKESDSGVLKTHNVSTATTRKVTGLGIVNAPTDDPGLINYMETVFALKSTMLIHQNQNIDTLPCLVGALSFIQEVNLSHNRLTLLPINLLTLPNLSRVYLHHNQIKTIPPFILGPAKLQVLDLHNNNITELPDLSPLASTLTMLDCERNQIRHFPEGLVQCENLYHLNLQHNQVKILPAALGDFQNKKLSYLNLRNNPITNLPPHIYQKGMAATLQFLKDHSANIAPPQQDSSAGLRRALTQVVSSTALFYDVILKSKDDVEMRAHSAVLYTRCPALREMIKKMRNTSPIPKRESSSSPTAAVASVPTPPHIVCLDVTAFQLAILLEYIYTDTITPLKKRPQHFFHNEMTEDLYSFKSLDNLYGAIFKLATQLHLPHLKCRALLASLEDTGVVLGTSSDEKSLFERQFKELYKSPYLHDICLKSTDSGNLIKAHKIVLCSRSTFLHALFTTGLIESSQKIVTMPDISHSVLKTIVEYCYTNDVEILESETVLELLITSKLYRLSGLTSLVESAVGFSLDVANVSSILSLAWTNMLPSLARACKFFVISNWRSVTSDPDWVNIDPAIRHKLRETAIKWKVISHDEIVK